MSRNRTVPIIPRPSSSTSSIRIFDGKKYAHQEIRNILHELHKGILHFWGRTKLSYWK